MTDPGFTEFDVTLRDGRAVHIRPIRATDEAEFVQAFDRMSDDARYMRFMRTVREPNRERLRKALGSFPEKGFGIAATVPAADGFDIAGSAIYVIGSDPTTCEFAVTVGSDFAGVGLARTLMTALIETAKRRGLKEMDGFVLTVNESMLGLARRLGFEVTPDPDDRSLRICRLRLGAS